MMPSKKSDRRSTIVSDRQVSSGSASQNRSKNVIYEGTPMVMLSLLNLKLFLC